MESEPKNPEFRINPELSPMGIPSKVSNSLDADQAQHFVDLILAQTVCKILQQTTEVNSMQIQLNATFAFLLLFKTE